MQLNGQGEQNRLSKPLFDTKLFTGHIEAYVAMYQRAQSGLARETIVVPDQG